MNDILVQQGARVALAHKTTPARLSDAERFRDAPYAHAASPVSLRARSESSSASLRDTPQR